MRQTLTMVLTNQSHVHLLQGLIGNALEKQIVRTEDSWLKPPRYVGCLDKGWMAQWIVRYDDKASQQDPISREFLDALEAADPKIIANLFQMFTVTTPYTELPGPCQKSKGVAGLTFTRRAQSIGNFMGNWRQKVAVGASLDPSKAGAYQLQFDEKGQCTEVVFLGKDKVKLPAEIVITKEFVMKDPFSVANCMVVKGMAKYRLLECWPEDQGPRALLPPSGKKSKNDKNSTNPLVTIAEKVAKDINKAKEEVASGFIGEVSDFVGQARKKRLAETLKAASERAAESSKRRREVSLK